MEIKMYLRMLQRGWWLVVLCTLTALAGSLTLSYMSEPVYVATARFVVSPDAALSHESDIINSINTLDKRSIATTYSAVLNSDTIYTQSIVDLKLDPIELDGYVRSAVVLPESNVLELYVEGTDPQLTMLLSNSIGKQAISYIDGLNQGYNIRVLDPAQIPVDPIRPQPARDASLSVVFGLVLGISLAIIREQLISPLEAFLKRNTIDQNSGVFTRQAFDQKMDEVLTRSPLMGFHTLGLVHLEGLVEYIDVIPKPLEQQVLHQVTKILNNELRGNDMVGRWDGATFSILLPGTPAKAAVITLGRVQTMLSGPIVVGGAEIIQLDPRIGLAERFENEPSSVLRRNAEQALKQAIVGNLNLVSYKPDLINIENKGLV
ncbi:MAG: diguanylate cyclase [Chloroflexi bacterium]|nr:diguanylate cyclase [Chloroflexota bacterium]